MMFRCLRLNKMILHRGFSNLMLARFYNSGQAVNFSQLYKMEDVFSVFVSSKALLRSSSKEGERHLMLLLKKLAALKIKNRQFELYKSIVSEYVDLVDDFFSVSYLKSIV
jgi:hypothetical protein